MKKLRELKTKQTVLLERMKTNSDIALAKQAEFAKEMLNAHVKATREMHRGLIGTKQKK